jgi:hypothetical protein
MKANLPGVLPADRQPIRSIEQAIPKVLIGQVLVSAGEATPRARTRMIFPGEAIEAESHRCFTGRSATYTLYREDQAIPKVLIGQALVSAGEATP